MVADAFCHNMVRALAGALLRVGDGSKPPGWPAQVLTAAASGIRASPCFRRTGSAWRRSATQPTPGSPLVPPSPATCVVPARGERRPVARRRRPFPRGCGGPYGWPVTMRLVRLTFAVPATRPAENASSFLRWVLPLGACRLVNSVQIKIK